MSTRFLTVDELNALLDCYRLTAVGYPVVSGDVPAGVNPFGRYGRMLRAVKIHERQVGARVPGAYKDLDDALGPLCGRVMP